MSLSAIEILRKSSSKVIFHENCLISNLYQMHVKCQNQNHFILIVETVMNSIRGTVKSVSFPIPFIFPPQSSKEILIISDLMRQLACFNFHYFIKTVVDCSKAIPIKILCLCIKSSSLHSSPRSCRVFIEPIKSFYLMNDQGEMKKRRRSAAIKLYIS